LFCLAYSSELIHIFLSVLCWLSIVNLALIIALLALPNSNFSISCSFLDLTASVLGQIELFYACLIELLVLEYALSALRLLSRAHLLIYFSFRYLVGADSIGSRGLLSFC